MDPVKASHDAMKFYMSRDVWTSITQYVALKVWPCTRSQLFEHAQLRFSLAEGELIQDLKKVES